MLHFGVACSGFLQKNPSFKTYYDRKSKNDIRSHQFIIFMSGNILCWMRRWTRGRTTGAYVEAGADAAVEADDGADDGVDKRERGADDRER